MATVGRRKRECTETSGRQGGETEMSEIGNNTHYTRQQVQNDNTTLHCKNDGETVQLIATQVAEYKKRENGVQVLSSTLEILSNTVPKIFGTHIIKLSSAVLGNVVDISTC